MSSSSSSAAAAAVAAAAAAAAASPSPPSAEPVYALHIFTPVAAAAAVRAALAAAGAGSVGRYDSASWTSAPGVGRFRPLAGARPAVGAVGVAEEVAEVLVVTEVRASRLARALAAARRAHPYEAPGIHVLGPLVDHEALLRDAAGVAGEEAGECEGEGEAAEGSAKHTDANAALDVAASVQPQ
jgi:hypothetical protein